MKFNPEIIKKYQQEIESYIPSISKTEAGDFSKIFYILTSKEIVTAQLIKLEKKIFEDADRKGIFSNFELFRILSNPNNNTKFKLLSDVLYTWAVENHLSSDFVKINRLLSNHIFQSLLGKGKFFKDIGVPAEHGAWSHFIQWYIIIEANKDHGFLTLNPYQLYKFLGHASSIGIKDGKQTPLWFLCCDNTVKIDQFDFRSPDNLHLFIKNNHDNQFFLLSTILKKGFKNIFGLRKNIPDYSYNPYSSTNNRLVIRKS